MSGLDDLLLWVLLIEYAAFGLLGIMVLVQRRREHAAWQRLAIYAFTREPIANLSPPTCTQLCAPDWIATEE